MPESRSSPSLVEFARSRYPRLAAIGGLAPDLALIFVFSSFLFLNFYPFGEPPKWSGFHTNAIVHAYVDAGYDYSGVREYVEANAAAGTLTSGARRPLYVWTVAFAHRLTGAPIESIYPLINWLSFTLAAVVLYVTCSAVYGLSRLSSFFAAVWLLLLPDVLVVYEAQAHPEGIGLLLIATSVLTYQRDRFVLAAVAMGLGGMVHESALFLVPYFAADLVFVRQQRPMQVVRSIAPFVIAVAVPLNLKLLLLAGTTASLIAPTEQWMDIARYISPHGLAYLAFNYQVLWIPFLCQVPEENPDRRAAILAYAVPWAAVVLMLTDTYRNLVPVSFFFVLPMAARFVSSCFREAQGRGWGVGAYLLITMFLFKQGAFDGWQTVPHAHYIATFAVLLAGSALARAHRTERHQLSRASDPSDSDEPAGHVESLSLAAGSDAGYGAGVRGHGERSDV